MSNFTGFAPSPLAPLVGKWLRDPISVSRNKVSKRILGDDGLKTLWACGSMAEVRQRLAADPELAEKYHALLRLGGGGELTITLRALTWREPHLHSDPLSVNTAPVTKAAGSGRGVVVSTGARGGASEFVLRMSK